MKRIRILALAALALAVLMSGCVPAEGGADTQTITSQDGHVLIDTPQGWSEDTTQELEGYLVLSIGDENGAFAQISYYPDDVSGDTAQGLAGVLMEDYYAGSIIGEVQKTTIGDNDDVTYFEYSMTDEGADGSTYNYHGYEYFIGFGLNIIEVDIYYSQGTIEGKLFSPSADQLALLRSIAETARLSE